MQPPARVVSQGRCLTRPPCARVCVSALCWPAAGLAARVPTVHSILLSAVVGPLGLLSHQLTKVCGDELDAPAACRSLCACMPRTAADPALPAIIPPLMSPAGAAAACCRCLPAQWVYSLLSAALGRDLRPAAKPVQERSGAGTLTIMPYD